MKWITEWWHRLAILMVVIWTIIRVYLKFGLAEGARRLERIKEHQQWNDAVCERCRRELNTLYDRYDEVLSRLETEVNSASSRGEKPPMTVEAQALFSEMEDLRRQIYETNQLLDDRAYLQRFKEVVGL